MMAIIHSLKCTVPFSFAVPLLSLAVTHYYSLSLFVTHFHSLSLVVPLVVTRFHSLSLAVIRCHLLYHSLSLVVISCHSFHHSFSLVVILCHLLYTHCHSFHSLSLFVTRCTTRLPFYKRSSGNYFLISAAFDSLQYNELNLLLQLTEF